MVEYSTVIFYMLHYIYRECQVPGLILLQLCKIGIGKVYLIIPFDDRKKMITIIYLFLLDIQTGDLSFRVMLRQVINILTEAGTCINNLFRVETFFVQLLQLPPYMPGA